MGISLSYIGAQGAAGALWLVDACPCLGAEHFCIWHRWGSGVHVPPTPKKNGSSEIQASPLAAWSLFQGLTGCQVFGAHLGQGPAVCGASRAHLLAGAGGSQLCSSR